jgi:phosphate-selective porin OprO/OprP
LIFAGLVLATPARAQPRLAAPAADSGLVGFDDEGLRFHSPDGRRQLKVRAFVTADLRGVLNDTADAPANGFALKRSWVYLDANLNPRVAFRVIYNIGPYSGPSAIEDAFVDVGFGGSWWLRAGRQKTPVGLERYMSVALQLLPERSLASMLHGHRDMGVLLTGELARGAAELSVGVFDGVPDGGGTQDVDPNDDKDLTYRLWLKPHRKRIGRVEQGFGIAFNGSTGIEKSPAVAGARLPTFRTPAQLPWFTYAEAAGVRAAGRHTRNGVFSHLHEGPFGAFAEWFSNAQVVSRGASTATVHTGGWLANAQYSLTGEPSMQEGLVPRAAFDPDKGQWGAWQLGARAALVHVGDEAFPTFADSTTAARRAVELGVGLNWFITRGTRVQLAYEHTTFAGGARNGDRRAERYVQLRWQAFF